mmetsp:Transcript_29905/g.77436  ORF Transcript_29905/g.77436 Transcript_29905/m.77436 type:complete len:318 (+) Transcript_29905:1214-2167(+)
MRHVVRRHARQLAAEAAADVDPRAALNARHQLQERALAGGRRLRGFSTGSRGEERAERRANKRARRVQQRCHRRRRKWHVSEDGEEGLSDPCTREGDSGAHHSADEECAGGGGERGGGGRRGGLADEHVRRQRRQVRRVVHADAVGRLSLRLLDGSRVEVEHLERGDRAGVIRKRAPEDAAGGGVELAREDRPLLLDLLRREPIHVVEEDHAREVAVGVLARRLVQEGSLDGDARSGRLEGLEVLGLEVAGAARPRVLTVEVRVVEVVVRRDVRLVENAMEEELYDRRASAGVGLTRGLFEAELRGGYAGKGAEDRQ